MDPYPAQMKEVSVIGRCFRWYRKGAASGLQKILTVLDASILGVIDYYAASIDLRRSGGPMNREDAAKSYRTMCSQPGLLDQTAPDPRHITPGRSVSGLVIASGYDPHSKSLPRANGLAAKSERPIHPVGS